MQLYFARCSGASGFFLPLSGGADSAAVAAIVYTMCRLAHAEHEAGDNPAVTKVVERLMKGEPCPSPEALCGAVLHTCYMGTSNSSAATLDRAKSLAGRIGSYHTNANIDAMVVAVMQVRVYEERGNELLKRRMFTEPRCLAPILWFATSLRRSLLAQTLLDTATDVVINPSLQLALLVAGVQGMHGQVACFHVGRRDSQGGPRPAEHSGQA